MDLVQLQKSTKQIRNPFGVDFVWTWDKQPIKIPADGKWYPVIGVLRDHLAKHLYNKVENQYYDEKVKELTEKNSDKEARAFSVPFAVKNKIWLMITGENLEDADVIDLLNTQDAADLSELHKELNNMDNATFLTNNAVSVAQLLDTASAQAENSHGGDTSHTSGSANILGETPPVTPVTSTPIPVDEVSLPQPSAPAAPAAPSTPVETPAAPASETFAGMSEINDESNV